MGSVNPVSLGFTAAQTVIGGIQKNKQARAQKQALEAQAEQEAERREQERLNFDNDLRRREFERKEAEAAHSRQRHLDERTRARLLRENDRQIEALQQTQARRNRQEQDRLRRALAARRARAGASGLSSKGGSVQAILNGLIAASGRDRADSDKEFHRNIGRLRTTKRNIVSDGVRDDADRDDAFNRAEAFRREQDRFIRENERRRREREDAPFNDPSQRSRASGTPQRSLLRQRDDGVDDVVGTFNTVLGFGRSLIG